MTFLIKSEDYQCGGTDLKFIFTASQSARSIVLIFLAFSTQSKIFYHYLNILIKTDKNGIFNKLVFSGVIGKRKLN